MRLPFIPWSGVPSFYSVCLVSVCVPDVLIGALACGFQTKKKSSTKIVNGNELNWTPRKKERSKKKEFVRRHVALISSVVWGGGFRSSWRLQYPRNLFITEGPHLWGRTNFGPAQTQSRQGVAPGCRRRLLLGPFEEEEEGIGIASDVESTKFDQSPYRLLVDFCDLMIIDSGSKHQLRLFLFFFYC